MNKGETFLIVGLGLMGGSYAMALTKAGYNVLAINRSEKSIEWAKEQHIITDGTTNINDYPAIISKADYIVLALYPEDIITWLTQYYSFFKPTALITDLCGVKCSFVPQAQQLLEGKNEYISSHPMAGKEVTGVQHADDCIFYHANFIITPTKKNTPQGIDFAYQLGTTLKFKHITTLSIEQHDQMIGYVSQLPHAIAVSLMNANKDPKIPEVTGDSFRDLTRIADINEDLWSDLFLSNKEFLIKEIDTFSACLNDLKNKVENNDKAGLQKIFKQSSARRKMF